MTERERGWTEREAEAIVLEAEVASVCGVINAAAARLVELIAAVLATGAWEGAGILSPAHWVGGSAGWGRGGPGGWCPWPAGWASCPPPGPPSAPAS